jgi:hypothetical protein
MQVGLGAEHRRGQGPPRAVVPNKEVFFVCSERATILNLIVSMVQNNASVRDAQNFQSAGPI